MGEGSVQNPTPRGNTGVIPSGLTWAHFFCCGSHSIYCLECCLPSLGLTGWAGGFMTVGTWNMQLGGTVPESAVSSAGFYGRSEGRSEWETPEPFRAPSLCPAVSARWLQPPAAIELGAGPGLSARPPGAGEAPRPDARGRPRELRRQEERVPCHRVLTPVRGHQVRWVPPQSPHGLETRDGSQPPV